MTQTLDLVDRLRGRYVLPVNDGAGPINGSMTFTSDFPTTPIQVEAALVIEQLRRGEKPDADDLMERLRVPCDPLNIGKLFVPPIHTEAIEEIVRLL